MGCNAPCKVGGETDQLSFVRSIFWEFSNVHQMHLTASLWDDSLHDDPICGASSATILNLWSFLKGTPKSLFLCLLLKVLQSVTAFLDVCLEQAKLPEAKWLSVGNLLLLVLFLHTYQGKTQLIFQILQKCQGICWWRASVQSMFFHFRAWVPRVLSENLWPQFEQSTDLESHLPAWWTDAASMDSCIPLPTTRYSLFRCFSKSITQGEGNQTSCVFLCLYCLGFWVFLSTHVHPCQIF